MAESVTEEYVIVPAAVAENSVGFSLDAGGSAAKIVYRAKEDYKNGRAINIKIPQGKGLVRLAKFRSAEVDKIVEYIADKCDVTTDPHGRKAYCTGMYSAEFEQKLIKRFNIGLESQTEFDLFVKAFRYLFHAFPRQSLVHGVHEQGLREAKEFLRTLTDFKEVSGDHSEGGLLPEVDTREVKEDLDTCDLVPCMLAQMGSCCIYHKINADWSFNYVDFTYFGGRSFMGISSAICGEPRPFDELMTMADVGKTRHVDVHASDVKSKESDDIYGSFPDDIPYFQFGQLSYNNPGNFSREDKVAGWVNLACAHYAQFTHLMALLHGVDRVFMSGGFCDNPTVRRYITKFWLARDVMFGMGRKVKIYFVKNSQYLGALGAILKEHEDTSAEKVNDVTAK